MFNYSTFEKVGNKKASTRFTDPVTGEVLRSRVGTGGSPFSEGGPLPTVGANPKRGDTCPLSYAHIRPQGGGKVECWLGGGLITVKKPKVGEDEQQGGGRRGKVHGFSRAAQTRMKRKMAQTRIKCKPLFVTLTYPDDFPGSPRQWKRDLKVFFQRLLRAFPEVGDIWKLEPQKRGAPHYHMLVWLPYGYAEIHKFTKWVADNWYEIVGSGDINHWKWHMGLLGNGNLPCVGTINSPRGAMAYAGKYMGKLTEEGDLEPELLKAWGEAGRWWGVIGKKNIPWADLVEVEVSFQEAAILMRLIRRASRYVKNGKMYQIKSRQYQSLNFIAWQAGADFWFDRLDRLLRT